MLSSPDRLAESPRAHKILSTAAIHGWATLAQQPVASIAVAQLVDPADRRWMETRTQHVRLGQCLEFSDPMVIHMSLPAGAMHMYRHTAQLECLGNRYVRDGQRTDGTEDFASKSERGCLLAGGCNRPGLASCTASCPGGILEGLWRRKHEQALFCT